MPVFNKKWRARQHARRNIGLVAVILGLTALAIVATMGGLKVYRSVYVQPSRVVPPPLHFRASRQTFPYSVVPGGVYDSKELKDTMRADPVARKHYNGLRVDCMTPVRIQAPLHAYVSYRIGDKIYWTTKKINIPRGELVLTDGTNMIRARCGNRITTRLGRTGSISTGQNEETLEAVFELPLPSLQPLPPFLQPVLPPGTHDVWTEPPADADATVTPEPATGALYTSGMLLIVACAAWRRRSSPNVRRS